MPLADAFNKAERYIQLRTFFHPTRSVSNLKQISDMIVMPVIAFFMWFAGIGDALFVISSSMTAYDLWKRYNEYMSLEFEMQRMRLRTAVVGGPFIVTNDPTYLPYVWADAVTRTQPESHPGSGRTRQRPKSHSRPSQ